MTFIASGVPSFLSAMNSIRSGVGAPITVGGRLWGMIAVSSGRVEPLAPETEAHLADFTDSSRPAIANAHAQAGLAASRARIVASADEARRKLERDLHDGAQQRLVTLAVRLRAAQAAVPPDLTSSRQNSTASWRG